MAGRGQFGSEVPSSLDLLLLPCLLSCLHVCVAPSFSAGALPSLSCESCSSPAIQQLLSLPGPRCSPGTCVLSGNLGSFSPWDSSSGEAHYANESQGQHLTCTVWLRKVSNLWWIFEALVRVSNEGLIPKGVLQLLVTGN